MNGAPAKRIADDPADSSTPRYLHPLRGIALAGVDRDPQAGIPVKPHFTAADRRMLGGMNIDLGDPRVTLREPDRLDTDRERYENMKREAAITIGQLSLERADALRRLNIANGIVAALVVALAGAACAILVRLR